MEDTIAAISTNSLGISAINIIRMSGEEAIPILKKVFSNSKIDTAESHTIHYGYIKDQEEIIDEVLVMIMKAPKTYTKEDIVEINCHGGQITTNKILELLLANGARLAMPGEFTKRAFLNGRINLLEAENVNDLLNAKTEVSKNMALNGISGKTTKMIQSLREKMVNLLANIEVNIDYPEYTDELVITKNNLKPTLEEINIKLKNIISESNNAKHIKNGIEVAIIGRPNVGKSSLLNALIEENKAIVTDISGTTRDIVEGSVIYENVLLNFIDTAGIRETDDLVEKIGVEKSKDILKNADINILVLNNNEELTHDDKELLKSISPQNSFIFQNKSDLPTKINIDNIKNITIIKGSTKNHLGLEELKKEILKKLNLTNLSNKELSLLTNTRQIALAKKAMKNLEAAIEANNNEIPIDMVALDIKEAWLNLGLLIGENYDEELVDNIFKNFCLGK